MPLRAFAGALGLHFRFRLPVHLPTSAQLGGLIFFELRPRTPSRNSAWGCTTPELDNISQQEPAEPCCSSAPVARSRGRTRGLHSTRRGVELALRAAGSPKVSSSRVSRGYDWRLACFPPETRPSAYHALSSDCHGVHGGAVSRWGPRIFPKRTGQGMNDRQASGAKERWRSERDFSSQRPAQEKASNKKSLPPKRVSHFL